MMFWPKSNNLEPKKQSAVDNLQEFLPFSAELCTSVSLASVRTPFSTVSSLHSSPQVGMVPLKWVPGKHQYFTCNLGQHIHDIHVILLTVSVSDV